MTAALPDDPPAEPAGSLEIRWMFPGELDPAIARWFARFPAGIRPCEDIYLLDPQLPALSVKIRLRRAFEVKAYRGSPAVLDIAGRARGSMQSWQKWSFPLGPDSPAATAPGGWARVRKTRRVSHFSLARGQTVTGAAQPGRPACSVELTEAHLRGHPWWTLGFEATGPAETLRTHLEATAALVFAQPPPGPAELGPASSHSYAEWLIEQAGRGANAEIRNPLGALRRLVQAYPCGQGHQPFRFGPVIIDWYHRQDEAAFPQPDLPDQNRVPGIR
jgi:hypothetical protein